MAVDEAAALAGFDVVLPISNARCMLRRFSATSICDRDACGAALLCVAVPAARLGESLSDGSKQNESIDAQLSRSLVQTPSIVTQ